MSRQAEAYERALFEVVREYNGKFYYDNISKVIEEEGFKVKVHKDKEEMVGFATITLSNGDTKEYEIRYNRIVNVSDSYTLLVMGIKAG
ncbi:MAG: hypothetical protein N3B21_15590 [Clostridia bacterium]|nr:hypothetical protein [Clostridia bacterium]